VQGSVTECLVIGDAPFLGMKPLGVVRTVVPCLLLRRCHRKIFWGKGVTMTDTSRRDFLRKASFGAVAVGAVATVPELSMSVPGLVVVQPGFPLRGVDGFLDGPTVCAPVSASAS